MKHNGSPEVVAQKNDVDKTDLLHVAGTHSFPATEETFLTRHGSCPHCEEEAYEVKDTPGFAIIGTLLACAFAFLYLGYGPTGMMTFLGVAVWMIVLGDFPEQMHRVLSRVGLDE